MLNRKPCYRFIAVPAAVAGLFFTIPCRANVPVQLMEFSDLGVPDFGPKNFAALGTTLYFTASTPAHGHELWKTDGTAAGTVLVKDIWPGIDGSAPEYLTVAGGTLYFTAWHPASGQELWKSDGTAAGTVLVKDLLPGTQGSQPLISMPRYLTAVGNTLYFSALHSTAAGGLWKSDGTSGGTVLVKGFTRSGGWVYPERLTAAGNRLYCTAFESGTGYELWTSDGTTAGTVMVKDIFAGSGSADPNVLAAAGGVLYFQADNGVNGRELWKSDGTAAGTVMVKDINPGSASGAASYIIAFGSGVCFTATDGSYGRELWKSDGTAAGTAMVLDATAGSGDSNFAALTAAGGTLYFTDHRGLWKTDGTAAGTVNFTGTSAYHDSLRAAGSRIFFRAYAPASGQELWKSDGTAGGTGMVMDLVPGTDSSIPSLLTVAGDRLYFRTEAGAGLFRVWVMSLVEPVPDIATTAPAGGINFGVVPGEQQPTAVITLQNAGDANLTSIVTSIAGSPDFAVIDHPDPGVPVAPGGTTTVTVRFSAGESGLKTAVLRIASNDPDENPFDIPLAATTVSRHQDTDSDGLNDLAEWQMAALGFNWQVSQPALTATLFSHAPGAGLYKENQIRTLKLQPPLSARDAVSGKLTFTLDWRRTNSFVDPSPFADFPVPPSGVSVDGDGGILMEFMSPDNAELFRIETK